MTAKTLDRKRNVGRSLVSLLTVVVASGAAAACSADDKSGATRGAGANDQGSGATPAGGSGGGASGSGGSAENGGTKATPGGSDSSGGTAAGGSNAAGSADDSGDKGGSGGKGGSSNGSGGTASHPVDVGCDLPGAAFCDTFSKPSPGGRAGDLDDAHWSLSRLGFGCAYAFAFPESPINVCGVWKTVEPGGPDSQFCLNENDEPRWAILCEALYSS